MFNDITQTSLKLVVLYFGFVCDNLVRHSLHYDWFGTQYIFVSPFDTDYILACMYGTDYILADTDGTHYILLSSYVHHILYYIR